MASPHHHHHHCQNHISIPTSTTTTVSCCCYSHCFSQPHHPFPPPPTPQFSTDSLLESLVSLLQQQQQQQQQPHLFSYCLNKHTKNTHRKTSFAPQKLHFQLEDDPQQTHFLLSSLLQRINSLESSLHHFSTSSYNSSHHYPSHSLRDTAARVIQTHFRAFLVRRSRTLSHLKELAFIKSSFNSLKSSISTKSHFDFEVVSHKAMDLLLKLDCIQGGDPMIRDGKRSVSRDLVRFLEFIDGFAVKRHELSYRSCRNARVLGNSKKTRNLNTRNGYRDYGNLTENQKEIVEKLRKRVEKISGFSRGCENDREDVELEGFQQFIDDDAGEGNRKVPVNGNHRILFKIHGGQPRVKKTVNFDENGNVFRVISDTSDGSDSSYDSRNAVKSVFVEAEEREGFSKGSENDEEAHLENGGSAQSSDRERIPERNLRNGVDFESNGYYLDHNGSLVFSAPVPAKMESRGDLMKKRKAVKIVT